MKGRGDAGPPDVTARTAAAREFERSLVVTAGAGSGKTTLLVERLLNACLGRGMPLSRVLALTFTERAAAEMRGRLAGALSDVLGALRGDDVARLSTRAALAWVSGELGTPDALVRERAVAALEDLEGGVVGTIHSACADLLRRHPVAAGVDPAFVVDEGRRCDRIFEEEWAAFVQDELLPGSERAEAWSRVLGAVDLRLVRDLARELVASPETTPRAADGPVEHALAEAVSARRRELARAAEWGTNRNLPDWLRRAGRLVNALEDGGVAAFRAALGEDPELVAKKTPPDPGARCENPEQVRADLSACLSFLRRMARVDDALIGTAVELARAGAARLAERLQVEGLVTFDALLAGARDVLRDHPAVRLSEQARLDAVLVDEFQDTDPLQYEIAFLLAERREGAGRALDPWELPLEPGALFVVGDLEQSIYRFRGADVAAAERAAQRVLACGGERLTLTANFRSREELLAPVNALCARAVSEDPPFQPAHVPLQAARPDAAAGEPRVEAWTVRHAAAGARGRREAEGRAIAAQISRWRDDGRVESFGDVALLFRAMTDVDAYQRALAEAGVDFVTQGGRGFGEREEVVQVATLLRCLAQPNDEAALLAVLRSPACGASDAEIARFAALGRFAHRHAARLTGEASGAFPVVHRTLLGLDELSRRAARLPADRVLRELLADRGPTDGGAWRPRLWALNASAWQGSQRLANLEKLLSRADELCRDESLSLARLAERLLDELGRDAREGESPLADEAVDAVRIMSVHAAKGLEFPVVVLPDVARREGGGRGEARARHAVRDGMVSVVLRDGRRNLASVLVDERERRHAEAERARLLYVAMTRAREWLVVVNGDPAPHASAWTAGVLRDAWGHDPDAAPGLIAGGSVVHRVLDDAPSPSVAERPTSVEELARAVTARDAARGRLARAAEAPPPPAWPAFETPSALHEPAAPAAGPAADRRAGAVARAVGTGVHSALELWDFGSADSLVALGERAARHAAEAEGVAADDVADETRAILGTLAASDVVQRLRRGLVLARELPVLFGDDRPDERRAWRGVVDLVFRDESGATWVLDWKTDRAVAPERHAAQLRVYAEAVRRWLALPELPRRAVLHARTGAWLEA